MEIQHDITVKENEKGNMIGHVLFDHRAKTVKMAKCTTKRKAPRKVQKPSGDCWHPPECVKHKTNASYIFHGKMCTSSNNSEAPSKKNRKITQTLSKRLIAIVRSDQKLGCVSQDVELPEQAVGLPNGRRSILTESGKRSPRAQLEPEMHEN